MLCTEDKIKNGGQKMKKKIVVAVLLAIAVFILFKTEEYKQRYKEKILAEEMLRQSKNGVMDGR